MSRQSAKFIEFAKYTEERSKCLPAPTDNLECNKLRKMFFEYPMIAMLKMKSVITIVYWLSKSKVGVKLKVGKNWISNSLKIFPLCQVSRKTMPAFISHLETCPLWFHMPTPWFLQLHGAINWNLFPQISRRQYFFKGISSLPP